MSDSELPPLEDASEIVNRIKKRKEKKEIKKISRDLLDLELKDEKYIPNQVLITKNNLDKNTETTKNKQMKTNNSGFGGFKAGFLNSNSKPKTKPKSKSNPTKKYEEIEEIITPKAKKLAENENPLILPEVQEKMKKELQDDQFLSSYEKDEKLMKQMADPRFGRAIQFMQRDPEGCKKYYMKNDPEFFKEFIEFFKKNMERIGSHIETKADQNSKQKTDDEKKMEEILNRPEVQRAVSDPEIQSLLSNLKTNPSKAQKQLAAINNETRQKIQILIQNGLLQLQ